MLLNILTININLFYLVEIHTRGQEMNDTSRVMLARHSTATLGSNG